MLGKELALQPAAAAPGEGSLAPLSLHSTGGVGVCEGVPLQFGVPEDEACACIAAPGSVPFGGEAAMGGFSSDWKPGEPSAGVATFFSGGGESAATAAVLAPQPIAARP